MKKILVVIDMQNDFIDGVLGTPEAVGIVDNVCKKIRGGEWEWIIRTMDTHFSNYLETQEGKKLPIKHCIEGTDGWCSNEDIRNAIQEYVALNADETGYCRSTLINKETFGTDNVGYYIDNYTHDYDIDDSDLEITLVGVCTDICVISNALLLKTYFPEAKIVVDASCCAGTTPEMHQKALDVMRSCQIDIVNDF